MYITTSYARVYRLLSLGQVEDQQFEDQQVEDQQVEDKQVENQQVEDQQVEDRQVEDQQVEDQQVGIDRSRINRSRIDRSRINRSRINRSRINRSRINRSKVPPCSTLTSSWAELACSAQGRLFANSVCRHRLQQTGGTRPREQSVRWSKKSRVCRPRKCWIFKHLMKYVPVGFSIVNVTLLTEPISSIQQDLKTRWVLLWSYINILAIMWLDCVLCWYSCILSLA